MLRPQRQEFQWKANAGKTTVLQKICNTSEQPSIQDRKGKLVPISTLSPSDKRGLHDIEQELIFPNNPNFLFHDSRGIEAGGKDELELVKQFIAKRASAKKLEDRIHVIWFIRVFRKLLMKPSLTKPSRYCIPVDNDRILTEAEKAFFENIGGPSDANNSEQLSHNIPVIAIFTKFDHLEIDAFTILQDEGLGEDEALKEAPHRAKSDFERDHLPRLLNCKNRPQSHIYLRDMHEATTSIAPLAEVTAEVLESTVLKLVFVSSQKSSIALCF
ncbi:hypothetical protein ONZ45_g14727 [Pleurotus djamor]|nr:hypothetical protein ONZ45_g14727 [Pleurotus djamor]